MRRNRLVAGATALVIAVAAALGTTAFAGVGPTQGATGSHRVCIAHGLNSGQSTANGVRCAPASLSISWNPAPTSCGESGDVLVSGSGLQPDSPVVLNIDLFNGTTLTQPLGDASSTGELSESVFVVTSVPSPTYSVTGTAADGSSITSNTLTC